MVRIFILKKLFGNFPWIKVNSNRTARGIFRINIDEIYWQGLIILVP